MIRHGLLICSFNLKKKYSKSSLIEYIPLWATYENNGKIYDGFPKAFKEFVANFTNFSNDEKMMKMFSIDSNSIKTFNRSEYMTISGLIESGSYGIESEITNTKSKRVVYKKTIEDADVKKFQFLFYIPKSNKEKAVKGIIIFESIGTFGVKTITTQKMKDFFSEKYDLTLETRSVSMTLMLEKLLKEQKLNKITLIKDKVSKDPVDNMFISVGKEETSYITPKLSDIGIKRLIEHIKGDRGDIIEINDEEYNDMVMTFKHMGHSKTVRLSSLDRFSIIEDVPEYIYSDTVVNRDKLIEYMENTAKDYAQKMVLAVE